jgi:hypothetical protein
MGIYVKSNLTTYILALDSILEVRYETRDKPT